MRKCVTSSRQQSRKPPAGCDLRGKTCVVQPVWRRWTRCTDIRSSNTSSSVVPVQPDRWKNLLFLFNIYFPRYGSAAVFTGRTRVRWSGEKDRLWVIRIQLNAPFGHVGGRVTTLAHCAGNNVCNSVSLVIRFYLKGFLLNALNAWDDHIARNYSRLKKKYQDESLTF